MPRLLIRSESTGDIRRIWPDPEPVPQGLIQEAGSYIFELKEASEAAAAELLIDDRPLEALRASAPDEARWRWSPGFHAGIVEAELRLPSFNPRRFEIVTDPGLRKLTRGDFDGMVREILEDTFALFSLSSFRRSIARGSGTRPPAIARLEFLRSRVDELEGIVSSIVRTPRHRLTSNESLVPYHRATRAKGPEVLRSFRTGRVLAEASRSRLPSALKGFLPQQIRVRQRLSSLDIPEHRQMGACLRAWSAWLSLVAETLVRTETTGDAGTRSNLSGWAVRCRRLAHRLARMAAEAPFAEAGGALPRLMVSAVFRNDPMYRQFFRLGQDMNLGLAAVYGDFLNMPLARTFELYELWCFLRLVRAAAEEFGSEKFEARDLFITDARGGLTLASKAVVVLVGNGLSLCFQKQYREFWREPDGRGSFSREMTPDVVVMRERSAESDGRCLIILDAKYRIDQGLNAALNSIHTYRDALVQESDGGVVEAIVTAAYLLTPHTPEVRVSYRETSLPDRLFHAEYWRRFSFGAITMRPGMMISQVRDVLRTITSDAAV